MSELNEVPDLSPALKTFFDAHAQTGEPTDEALARGKSRLLRPVYRTTKLEMRARPRRDSMALKVLAAIAAMLIAGLGAGGVFVMLLQSGATVTSADLRAIRAAYDAQDLDEALRITARSDETLRRSLSLDLALEKGLLARLETLSSEELAQLRSLDSSIRAKLNNTDLGAIGTRILAEQSRRQPVNDIPAGAAVTERLANEATSALRQHDTRTAIALLNQCVAVDPNALPCIRQLASAYSQISQADDDARAFRMARGYYHRYLDIAPTDDPYVPTIRAILEASPPREP